MRKPTPNLLGVGAELDEQAVTEHINKTLKAAKGCHIEFIQRDVYKINNTPDKVRRYVDLIRNCCEKHEN
jgi:biotin operon repressor